MGIQKLPMAYILTKFIVSHNGVLYDSTVQLSSIEIGMCYIATTALQKQAYRLPRSVTQNNYTGKYRVSYIQVAAAFSHSLNRLIALVLFIFINKLTVELPLRYSSNACTCQSLIINSLRNFKCKLHISIP